MEPKYEVPIIALEDALQVPLEPMWIKKLNFNFELLERLYFSLKKYHLKNRIQPKQFCFRPNLSFGHRLSGIVVSETFDDYNAGTFIPRNGGFKIPTQLIKSTLLFSHEVVIEDPIFSFCRWALTQRWSGYKPSYTDLKDSLLSLAHFKSLLETRILRITSFFPTPVRNDRSDFESLPREKDTRLNILRSVGTLLAPTDFANPNIRAHVGMALGAYKKDENVIDVSLSQVVEQLIKYDDYEPLYILAEAFQYAYDDGMPFSPFLPSIYSVNNFKKLITVLPKFKPNYINTLLDLPALISTDCINPDKIEIKDLVNIRKDEIVFEEWRKLVSESMNKARELSKNGFNQIDTFKAEMEDRGNWWNSNFAKFKKGEPYLRGVLKETKIGVGGIGIAVGALASGGELLPSLLAGAGTEAVQILHRCLNQFERYDSEKAAMSFFMSLNNT